MDGRVCTGHPVSCVSPSRPPFSEVVTAASAAQGVLASTRLAPISCSPHRGCPVAVMGMPGEPVQMVMTWPGLPRMGTLTESVLGSLVTLVLGHREV